MDPCMQAMSTITRVIGLGYSYKILAADQKF